MTRITWTPKSKCKEFYINIRGRILSGPYTQSNDYKKVYSDLRDDLKIFVKTGNKIYATKRHKLIYI